MRESWMLAARRIGVSLGLCGGLFGCAGDDPPDDEGANSAGVGVGDETGGADDDDDDDDDDDENEGDDGLDLDLGGADDGVGEPEGCVDEVPEPFDIPTDETCQTEPAVGVFTPLIEWTKYEWLDTPGSRSSVTTPVVAQISDDNLDGIIDDEDIPDIIFVTYETSGMLRAVQGDGSAETLSVNVSGFNRETSIAAADIDNDGVVEILGVNSGKRLVALEHDGTEKWISEPLGGHIGTWDNAPSISDMNGDGSPEIVVGRAIFDSAGNLIAAGEYGSGSASGNASLSLSFAVDVDGDGQQEVVAGNALYRMDGTAIWHTDEPDGYPATIDTNLDGVPEIVVVWNHNIRVQSSVDGSVLWTAAVPGGNGGPPTVADYDGDGLPEIGIAGNNSYTVWEHDGTEKWSNVTQDFSSGITGSAVFDFEGDGVADVVYADETRLWVYAGHDGTVKLEHEEHSSGTRVEYPIIADVDGDGEVEIAYVNEAYNGNLRGLTVLGDANHSWQPGRKIWNQHAYHITNVADDGGVPANADQNWLTYNNFRSGHTGPNDGLAIPGVQLFGQEPCDQGCSEGLRTVYLQVGNGGAGQLVAEVEVDVYGVAEDGSETLLGTLLFAPPLDAGQTTEPQGIEVDPSIYVSVRADGTADEILCDLGAIEVSVAVPECPLAPPPAG